MGLRISGGIGPIRGSIPLFPRRHRSRRRKSSGARRSGGGGGQGADDRTTGIDFLVLVGLIALAFVLRGIELAKFWLLVPAAFAFLAWGSIKLLEVAGLTRDRQREVWAASIVATVSLAVLFIAHPWQTHISGNSVSLSQSTGEGLGTTTTMFVPATTTTAPSTQVPLGQVVAFPETMSSTDSTAVFGVYTGVEIDSPFGPKPGAGQQYDIVDFQQCAAPSSIVGSVSISTLRLVLSDGSQIQSSDSPGGTAPQFPSLTQLNDQGIIQAGTCSRGWTDFIAPSATPIESVQYTTDPSDGSAPQRFIWKVG